MFIHFKKKTHTHTHRGNGGEAREGSDGGGEVGEDEAQGPHGGAEEAVVLEVDGVGKGQRERAVEERQEEERRQGLEEPLVGV